MLQQRMNKRLTDDFELTTFAVAAKLVARVTIVRVVVRIIHVLHTQARKMTFSTTVLFYVHSMPLLNNDMQKIFLKKKHIKLVL